MSDNDFDPVSWRSDGSDTEGSTSRPSTAKKDKSKSKSKSKDSKQQQQQQQQERDEPQAGPNADDLDLAGVKYAQLECHVSDPQKESDGTKGAFVSYLVTTDVCHI